MNADGCRHWRDPVYSAENLMKDNLNRKLTAYALGSMLAAANGCFLIFIHEITRIPEPHSDRSNSFAVDFFELWTRTVLLAIVF